MFALSPYDLAFSATVFTDIQATFWVLMACLLVARDRWWWAGLAAGLMFASKSNQLLFLPLILALGVVVNVEQGWTRRDLFNRIGAFALVFGIGCSLLSLWDLGRAPRSFWMLNTQRNNPGRFIRSEELIPRLRAWGYWLHFATGSTTINIVLTASGGVRLVDGLWRRSRTALIDWVLAGFVLAFLGFHWLIAFNTYDRYLHTLMPFLLILAARGLRMMTSVRRGWIVVSLMPLLMIPSTAQTLHGDVPLGGDQGKHTGIDELAAYINRELPDEIVYDHWLGWELAYYAPRVHLLFMPLPEDLADDMAAQPNIRYFVVPSEPAAAPWIAALARRDISSTIVYQTHGFIIYRLSPS
jgi:hypothetical protein